MAPHIVKSYDAELDRLNEAIARMGGLAETQLTAAIEALCRRDKTLAEQVIDTDAKVDQLEETIDAQAIRVLALRQPVAADLRVVVTAIRIATDIERIADYASNVAKRTIALSKTPFLPGLAVIPRMGDMARLMIKDILDAFAERDIEKARRVWESDAALDQLYESLFRELLTHMMEDPRAITAATHLLFIAKNIERIGDHATNIAELVHYLVEGTPIGIARPKKDRSSFVPPGDEGTVP